MAADDFDDDDDRRDDDRDDDRRRDRDDEPSVDEGPPPVRAKTPVLAIVLILLNLAVLPVFLFLLMMDYEARTNFSYNTFLNYVLAQGLPLEEDEKGNTLAQDAARVQIDGQRLREAHKKRVSSGSDVKGGEVFASVDEVLPIRIKPSDIDAITQKHIFGSLGEPVRTQDAEVVRLKNLVPTEMEKVADELAARFPADDARRAAARKLLLPMAWSTQQVEKLEKQIAEAAGPKLDELLKDAVQRRMLADVLAPLNVARPGDVDKLTVERLSETDVYPLELLKGLLQQHFEAALKDTHVAEVYKGRELEGVKRDTADKRRHIAVLLFTLGQVRKPESPEPLLPNQLERAQVVSGLHEFAAAASAYVQAERELEQRVLAALQADREGYEVMVKDKVDKNAEVPGRAAGFVRNHDAEVQRLRKIVSDIAQAQERLKTATAQRETYRKLYDERVTHMKDMTGKLLKARAQSKEAAVELQRVEAELVEALKVLADAAQKNVDLERAIRKAEAGR